MNAKKNKFEVRQYTVHNANGSPATLNDFVAAFNDGRYMEMKSKGLSEDFMMGVYSIDVQMALLPGPFAHTVNADVKAMIEKNFFLV